MYRHDPDTDTGTFGEIRFFSGTDDSDLSWQSEMEAWLEAPPVDAEEG